MVNETVEQTIYGDSPDELETDIVRECSRGRHINSSSTFNGAPMRDYRRLLADVRIDVRCEAKFAGQTDGIEVLLRYLLAKPSSNGEQEAKKAASARLEANGWASRRVGRRQFITKTINDLTPAVAKERAHQSKTIFHRYLGRAIIPHKRYVRDFKVRSSVGKSLPNLNQNFVTDSMIPCPPQN